MTNTYESLKKGYSCTPYTWICHQAHVVSATVWEKVEGRKKYFWWGWNLENKFLIGICPQNEMSSFLCKKLSEPIQKQQTCLGRAFRGYDSWVSSRDHRMYWLYRGVSIPRTFQIDQPKAPFKKNAQPKENTWEEKLNRAG